MDGWKKAAIIGGIWGLISSIFVIMNYDLSNIVNYFVTPYRFSEDFSDLLNFITLIVFLPAEIAVIMSIFIGFFLLYPVVKIFGVMALVPPVSILIGALVLKGIYTTYDSLKDLDILKKAIILGGLWGFITAVFLSVFTLHIPITLNSFSSMILFIIFLPEKIIFLTFGGPVSDVFSITLFVALSTSIGLFIGAIYHTISMLFGKDKKSN